MPYPLKFETIESRNYELQVISLYGVWRLRRKRDGAATLLSTGTEGFEDYRTMKATWRRSRLLFDLLCAEYSFSTDEEA